MGASQSAAISDQPELQHIGKFQQHPPAVQATVDLPQGMLYYMRGMGDKRLWDARSKKTAKQLTNGPVLFVQKGQEGVARDSAHHTIHTLRHPGTEPGGAAQRIYYLRRQANQPLSHAQVVALGASLVEDLLDAALALGEERRTLDSDDWGPAARLERQRAELAAEGVGSVFAPGLSPPPAAEDMRQQATLAGDVPGVLTDDGYAD